MQDDQILNLYWNRDEEAIRSTAAKYGRYLAKIALNVLGNHEDCEESVNDTYLKAWNTIPPQRPESLGAYLARLARQTSIDLFRKQTAKKRRAAQYPLTLAELTDCLASPDNATDEAESDALLATIEAYLHTLPEEPRNIFICRYFFLDPIRAIAFSHNATESKIKSQLYRTRLGLKTYLEQEGFTT